MDKSIKIYRDIIEWEWYKNTNVKAVYFHLLLIANSTESTYQGKQIYTGQLVTTYSRLSNQLDISVAKVKLSLKKLIKSDYIEMETTNKYSIISVYDYEKFIDKIQYNYENNQIFN